MFKIIGLTIFLVCLLIVVCFAILVGDGMWIPEYDENENPKK